MKREIIQNLENIAEQNYKVKSFLKMYKKGYKSLDQVMLEMILVMSVDIQLLKTKLEHKNKLIKEKISGRT